MARMVYDEKLGKVVDKSPGRSIYLSNKQWQAVKKILEDIDFADDDTGAFTKLYRVSEEVCNREDVE